MVFLYFPVVFYKECTAFSEFWFHNGDSIKSAWWGVALVLTLFVFWALFHVKTDWHIKKQRFAWTVAVLLPCISAVGLMELKEFSDFQDSGNTAHVFFDDWTEWQQKHFIRSCEYRDKQTPRYCPKTDFCEEK